MKVTTELYLIYLETALIPSPVNEVKSETWRPRHEKHQAIKALVIYSNGIPKSNILTWNHWAMYIHYFRQCNISGSLHHENPFTSAANLPPTASKIRHVFCFGAYSRAQSPDILNRAQWKWLNNDWYKCNSQNRMYTSTTLYRWFLCHDS